VELDKAARCFVTSCWIGAAFEDDEAGVDAGIGKPALDLRFDDGKDAKIGEKKCLQAAP